MSDDQVQEIKDRIDIVDLVNQYVPLKKAGANHKGLCPFHKEKTPSFMVSGERQSYRCFGCDEAGDVISFLQKMEGLTFPEALRLLADRVGVKLQQLKNPERYQQEKDEKTILYRINAAASKYFHKTLAESPEARVARDYLSGRSISDKTINDFLLGYAPSNNRLGQWLLSKGVKQNQLTLAGGPDRFRNRIIFPLFDPLGNVVGFTGRSMPGDERGPKYLNTPETPIFKKSKLIYGLSQGKKEIRHEQRAILVEGQVDVILSHQVGLTTAVASSGTALTPSHLETIRRYAPKVCLAFDADSAGLAATKKALRLAIQADLVAEVISFPKGIKDAGEAIEKDPAIWKKAVSGAISGMSWLIRTSAASYPQPLDGAAKRAVAAEVLPVVALVSNPVEQAHYLAELGKHLAVSEQVLRSTLEKTKKMPQTPAVNPGKPKQKQLSLADQLLALVLFKPGLINELELVTKDLDLSDLNLQVFNRVKTCYTANERQPAAKFLFRVKEEFDRTSQAEIDRLVAEGERLAVGNDPARIATDILVRINSNEKESIKKTIAAQIAAAESTGDIKQVKKLMKELQASLGK